MLESLKINNFVLIPSINLELYDGMTVLTGETGSGKSIVLGAISLILGAKADKEEIRAGEDKAELEAVFRSERKALLSLLQEKGIDVDDGYIIIRRQIKSNGRSLYTVNGVSITLSEGQEIGRLLVDITRQNSSQSLMKKDVQRRMLDSSSDIRTALSSYSSSFLELKDLEGERSSLLENLKRIQEDKSYYEYSLNELEKAELRIGEDDEIKEKLDIASSSEFLVEHLNDVRSSLDEASKSLSRALNSLSKAKGKDENLEDFYCRLESCSIENDDILQSISEHLSSYSFDPYELEQLNSRLALLQRLRKKYGGSIEMAISRREELKGLLSSSQDDEMRLEQLEKAINDKRTECLEKADILHSLRLRRAEKLEKSIIKTLKELSMESAVFKIDICKDSLSEHGYDRISFQIAPNKGEKMSAIEDAASGGELSRIMLAIKSNFLDSEDVETLIFDEIDTGISGHAASNVSSVMKEISRTHQIIAITHLAQIASKADNHILVSKKVEKGRTVSHLGYISGDDKVMEIARLLSGDGSEIALEHAKSLLEV